ncbi:MAG TPA: trypsin-like peptidase domain-containing protein [Blastocatellia bacterium]|nr:trypsin-like peptidase domain-containing protein [Blastocatellia bacterium]
MKLKQDDPRAEVRVRRVWRQSFLRLHVPVRATSLLNNWVALPLGLIVFTVLVIVLPTVGASSQSLPVAGPQGQSQVLPGGRVPSRVSTRTSSAVSGFEDRTKQGSLLPSKQYKIQVNLTSITKELDAISESALTGAPTNQIGVGRKVGAASDSMGQRIENADGTKIRMFAVRSPGADSLRVHIENLDLPPGDLVYVYGLSETSHVSGPYTAKGPFKDGELWTDTVQGDTAIIEHMFKGKEHRFQVTELTHVFKRAKDAAIRPAVLACEVDASCISGVSEKNGVGRIDFISGGQEFVCTGTLLNDAAGDDQPFFLTANHCVSTQASARTLQVWWFYQTSACNSGVLTSSVTESEPTGATLLATDRTSDSTLLSINGQIPSGVVFAGWDPAPQSVGTQVFSLHHPDGFVPPDPDSFLRYTHGTILMTNDACDSSGPFNAYQVQYDTGLTEAGSSGSGIFATENGGQHFLVGLLTCGPDEICGATNNFDDYHKFSDFFPLIQSILSPSPVQTIALTSGASQSAILSAAPAGQCALASTQYTIQVPSATSQLTITLAGNQQDGLFVRLGSAVSISGGSAVADFTVENAGNTQTLTIDRSSTPALQAGTYFIDVGNCSQGKLRFGITATITSPLGSGGPAISSLVGDLNGDVLTLSGSATDLVGVMTQAQVRLFDGAGNQVGDTGLMNHSFGGGPSSLFSIQVNGLDAIRAAVSAGLTITDATGLSSTAVQVIFTQGDASGPTIRRVGYDVTGGVMTIKGGLFGGAVQLEVNGVIVAPPAGLRVKSGAKIKAFGSSTALNLSSGPNRIRLIDNGARSNFVVINL